MIGEIMLFKQLMPKSFILVSADHQSFSQTSESFRCCKPKEGSENLDFTELSNSKKMIIKKRCALCIAEVRRICK